MIYLHVHQKLAGSEFNLPLEIKNMKNKKKNQKTKHQHCQEVTVCVIVREDSFEAGEVIR